MKTTISYQYLLCEIKNKVAIITLNRPPVNALNSQVFVELSQLFTELEANEEVHVIVLTGSGEKAFVAGADINEMASANIVTVMKNNKNSREVFTQVENSTKPVIAAINGLALGGGLELALACDIRISSDKAKFSFPETGLGIIPGGGGTQRLQKIVGLSVAKELIYFGDMIDAHKALDLHILNKVVPADELLTAAKDWAEKLASKPPIAVQMAKLALNTGSNTDVETGLIVESTCFNTTFATEDAKEGLHAFVEKRKPVYIGR